jgi:hypothetical protein
MVISVESLAENPQATRQDIQAARDNLATLLGTVTLKPRDGILWAHPAPNARGLVETRPLDGLRINSPVFGSGGRMAFAPAGLSYVGRLRRPRSALFRQHQGGFG